MESDYGVEELKSLPLHESASPNGGSGSKKEGEFAQSRYVKPEM